MDIKTILWLSITLLVVIVNNGNAEIFERDVLSSFYYFAYGSNLLKKRMHINCPSAKFIAKAKLVGYRLDFNITVPKWMGAAANIVADQKSTVWGAVWEIDNEEMNKLDDQEGVHLGWYVPKYVWVNATFGETTTYSAIHARTYIEPYPTPNLEPEKLPINRQPSRTYFQTILFGAIECRLPVTYLDYLQRFPNNGMKAKIEILHQLGYPFWERTAADYFMRSQNDYYASPIAPPQMSSDVKTNSPVEMTVVQMGGNVKVVSSSRESTFNPLAFGTSTDDSLSFLL